MTDAGDQRVVALLFRPCNGFMPSWEGAKRMAGMVFDDIIVDTGAFGPALGARLNIDARHGQLLKSGIAGPDAMVTGTCGLYC